MNSEPLCTFYIFLITHKGRSVHLGEKNATTMHCSGIDSFLKTLWVFLEPLLLVAANIDQ
jgi:hypothetical protein